MNTPEPLPPEESELLARYHAAAHAVQSGVKMNMTFNPTLTEPKHLRVGVDLRACEISGLATLLIKKGVITRLEYVEAMAVAVEQEVAQVQHELSQKLGAQVTLL